MYSRAHGAVSLVVGVGLVAAGVVWIDPVLSVGYATAVGVLIDLDHFVIARYNSGEWRAARSLLSNPRRILFDQSKIFERAEVTAIERLLSHVLIVGITVPATWFIDPDLGLLTAVALYAHVLADLIADVRRSQPLARGGATRR